MYIEWYDDPITEIENAISHHVPKTTLVKVINESSNHHRGNHSHFRILVVSDVFENMSKVERHRHVYQAMQQMNYHALGITTLTNAEYQDGKLENVSPDCVKNS
jgi:BolA protein